jgi:hypothetical protein
MGFTKKEVLRFESKVVKSDESSCWTWVGPKFDTGYGMFCMSGRERKTFAAHRVSWMIHFKMDIPAGMFICHTCDNRICVNPEHLYLGTPTQNNTDTVKRGRANRKVGSDCSWAKVTEAQVRKILESPYESGANSRFSREFGIHQSQVSHIRSGRRWSHIARLLKTVDIKIGLIAGKP